VSKKFWGGQNGNSTRKAHLQEGPGKMKDQVWGEIWTGKGRHGEGGEMNLSFAREIREQKMNWGGEKNK